MQKIQIYAEHYAMQPTVQLAELSHGFAQFVIHPAALAADLATTLVAPSACEGVAVEQFLLITLASKL